VGSLSLWRLGGFERFVPRLCHWVKDGGWLVSISMGTLLSRALDSLGKLILGLEFFLHFFHMVEYFFGFRRKVDFSP
jgi:hypothetical protein